MSSYVDINLPAEDASTPTSGDRSPALVAGVTVAAWATSVTVAAASGALAQLYRPLIAAIVALTIAAPMMWYALSPALRGLVERIGHRRIVQFHIWRIPAALLFFWYGFQGALAPPFWILAGTGDFLIGSYAVALTLRRELDPRSTLNFHRFGFFDFMVAVGTGLIFTLLDDPLMAPVAALPLALVPLLGVGISGASHLMAFDMLRRGTGFASPAG